MVDYLNWQREGNLPDNAVGNIAQNFVERFCERVDKGSIL
jgi:hypothetical protein